MWIIEFFIETIVKDSELISLPFTAEYDIIILNRMGKSGKLDIRDFKKVKEWRKALHITMQKY